MVKSVAYWSHLQRKLDGEFDEEVTDDDDEDDEETSSPSSKKLSIGGDAVGQKSKSGDKLREDACSEDVSRPIDKNDVDWSDTRMWNGKQYAVWLWWNAYW